MGMRYDEDYCEPGSGCCGCLALVFVLALVAGVFFLSVFL